MTRRAGTHCCGTGGRAAGVQHLVRMRRASRAQSVKCELRDTGRVRKATELAILRCRPQFEV